MKFFGPSLGGDRPPPAPLAPRGSAAVIAVTTGRLTIPLRRRCAVRPRWRRGSCRRCSSGRPCQRTLPSRRRRWTSRGTDCPCRSRRGDPDSPPLDPATQQPWRHHASTGATTTDHHGRARRTARQDFSFGSVTEGSKTEAELPKADSEVEFLARGQQAPSPPARGFGERCKLPRTGFGRSPAAQRFSTIFSTQDGIC